MKLDKKICYSENLTIFINIIRSATLSNP